MPRLTRIHQIAIAATLLYLCLYGFVFYDASPQTVADRVALFTGFFTPLALIWVVAGFYQQREAIRDTRRALELSERAERARLRSVQPVIEMIKPPGRYTDHKLELRNHGVPATQVEITCSETEQIHKKELFGYLELWAIPWPDLFPGHEGPLVFRITYFDATHALQTQEYVYENEQFTRRGSLPLDPPDKDNH
ncbi:hypothetical protein J2T55_000799 [Methylohalomonas lacus]|uniref:Uncharacterized protein n=1 Tax=Methylohalomonas lacus TaxID=398773 RepID=A0AAE3HJ48_9GAMM|nr:hypothetical protein [Methylohalomonas lacus]MCS3902795.1 hypothetical protein [Methylohalomonas lacus]